MHVVHRHAYKQNTRTHKNKSNVFKIPIELTMFAMEIAYLETNFFHIEIFQMNVKILMNPALWPKHLRLFSVPSYKSEVF